jgi:hypothetical protein
MALGLLKYQFPAQIVRSLKHIKGQAMILQSLGGGKAGAASPDDGGFW